MKISKKMLLIIIISSALFLTLSIIFILLLIKHANESVPVIASVEQEAVSGEVKPPEATTTPPETTTTAPPETTTKPPRETQIPQEYIPTPVRSDFLQSLVTQKAETPRGIEYFDNSMIIGDSIITGFSIWQQSILLNGKPLENVVIFASGSYGIFNSLQEISQNTIHPLYEGEQIRPEDAVTVYEVERVFIAMGLNDVYFSLDTFINNYRTLINRIADKNPDVEIIILPIPPYMHTAQPTPDRNARIAEYNNALILLAYEMGIAFIDSTVPLRDENDGLKPEFCGDSPPAGQGCHWVPIAYSEVLKHIVEHPAG